MKSISVDEAIFTTRSMRHLRPDPVPREDLEYIVEAATMAPSAGNYQMWTFVVVTDEATRQKIGAAYQESGTAYIRDSVLADPNTDDERMHVYGKAMYTVDHLAEAPVIVVACATVPIPDDSAAASGVFGSVFPAIQNLMLAARGRGLGTVLLTLATDHSPIDPKKNTPVREILNLPEGVEAVGLIPVGYPRGKWGRPRRDESLKVLHCNTWEG
ncbi:MAG: nitroreductase family protein [Proteobacteria bacterium]|nr:nitroreductase family protein [Pseudomonadota bacterium]